MQFQIGWRIANLMLPIFRIVSTVEGEESFAVIRIEIAHLIGALTLGEYRHALLDEPLVEHRRLTHEALDDIHVILR